MYQRGAIREGDVGDGGTVQLDPAHLDDLVQRFAACGSEVVASAGGVDRAVPAVPDDEHDIRTRFVELDEARERLDMWAAERLHEVSRRLAVLGVTASGADRFTGLPPGR